MITLSTSTLAVIFLINMWAVWAAMVIVGVYQKNQRGTIPLKRCVAVAVLLTVGGILIGYITEIMVASTMI